MGLTTWESGPEGRIYKKDVIVAKKFIYPLKKLNNLSERYPHFLII